MPLFNRFPAADYHEDYMQAQVVEFIQNSDRVRTYHGAFSDKPTLLREFRVPECHRISDIVVHFSKRKMMNVECKIQDIKGVINQAMDHLLWADYSIICMPHDTYIANSYRIKLINEGIGLLIWVKDQCLIEAIYPAHNKSVNKHMRSKIYQRFESEAGQRTLFE